MIGYKAATCSAFSSLLRVLSQPCSWPQRLTHGFECSRDQAKLVANDVTVIMLKNTGHWILEENPKETIDALTKFL